MNVVTAAGALGCLAVVYASAWLVRYLKAGGERWDARDEQQKKRLALLPGFVFILIVLGVVIFAGNSG